MQILTAPHIRWMAYKGESKDPTDLLFTAETTSVIQFKSNLNVYLANNKTSEDVCDFKVEGSWSERSCVIYVGKSKTIAARVSNSLDKQYGITPIFSRIFFKKNL